MESVFVRLASRPAASSASRSPSRRSSARGTSPSWIVGARGFPGQRGAGCRSVCHGGTHGSVLSYHHLHLPTPSPRPAGRMASAKRPCARTQASTARARRRRRHRPRPGDGPAYKSGVDRLLTSPERVTSVADALALLEVGRALRGALRPRPEGCARGRAHAPDRPRRGPVRTHPAVLIASTALAAGMTVRRGVRELQVIAALIEHRIEQATGERADPGPRQGAGAGGLSQSEVRARSRARRRPLASLAARRALRGAIGRDTGSAAYVRSTRPTGSTPRRRRPLEGIRRDLTRNFSFRRR